MISMPLGQIKEKIIKKTTLSESEVNDRIKDKLRLLSGLISEEGAAHIVANELGVKLFEVGEKLQVKNVLSGMRNIDLNAKVVQKYDVREFNSAKGPGKVLSMLVGDETGVIRLVLWNKQAENGSIIKEGDVVKIVGGYVRENQGRSEVHLNDLSKLIANPQGVSVDVKPRQAKEYERKRIVDINEGDESIEILATIVQVFDISFFEVCPKCGKRARLREEGFACQVHDMVNPEFNYVVNLYLDDGSDNIRVVLWRETVEELLGMQRERVLAFKDDPALFEAVKNDLLGNMVIVSGKAQKNSTFDRIEVVAQKVNRNPNPVEEAKRIRLEPAKEAAQEGKAGSKALEPGKPQPEKAQPGLSGGQRLNDDFSELNIDDELVDIED